MDGLLYLNLAHSMLGVESKEASKERHVALGQEAVLGDAALNARAGNNILESHRDLCIQGRVNLSVSFRHKGT